MAIVQEKTTGILQPTAPTVTVQGNAYDHTKPAPAEIQRHIAAQADLEANAYDHTKPLSAELKQHIASEVKHSQARLKRTTFGLQVFDHVLFHAANLAVFALSVFATYKTNYAHDGNWLENRTNTIVKNLESRGIKKDTASDLNAVLWSFVDGVIALPFIAVLKGQRAAIGRSIDNFFGIVPENQAVYEQQEKEGMKSVVLGRVAAFLTVIPTCLFFAKKDKNDSASVSVNDALFKMPSKWIADNNVGGFKTWLGSKGFNEEQSRGLIHAGIFEIVYTTICSAVLFAVSPMIGRLEREKHEKYEALLASKKEPAHNPLPAHSREQETGSGKQWQSSVEPKKNNIANFTRSEDHKTLVTSSKTTSRALGAP